MEETQEGISRKWSQQKPTPKLFFVSKSKFETKCDGGGEFDEFLPKDTSSPLTQGRSEVHKHCILNTLRVSVLNISTFVQIFSQKIKTNTDPIGKS
jgi:hypothetical protein